MATNKGTSPVRAFFSENKLRLGMAGFIVGALAALIIVGLASFVKTYISYRFAARSYSSVEYHLLLDEFDRMLYLDSYAAFDLIEAETETNPNKVDQLEGLIRFARFYQLHNDNIKVNETFRRVLGAATDYIDDAAYQDELAILYYLAIDCARNIGDHNHADHLYTLMLDSVPDSIQGSSDLLTTAKSYFYLVSATYERAFDDENWEITGRYYGEMKETIEPRLDELASVYEIGSVYDYLTNTAMLFLDIGAADRYQGELKSKLLSMKNDVSGPEANALLNRYLGDVEIYFEMPLVAASYYRQMVNYNPTATNINLVAFTYAEAGDYECAYKYYQRLLDVKDPSGGAYHWMARNAVNSIKGLILCEGESCCP